MDKMNKFNEEPYGRDRRVSSLIGRLFFNLCQFIPALKCRDELALPDKILTIKRSLLIIFIISFIELTSNNFIGFFIDSEDLSFNLLVIINLMRISEFFVIYYLIIIKWKGDWEDFGFDIKNIKKDLKWAFIFIIGLGSIVIASEIIIYLIYKQDLLSYLVDYSLPINDIKYMTIYIFTIIFSACIVEELFFRYIIYGMLRTKLNIFFSILITSLIFAFLHFSEGYYSIIPLAGGILFAILYEITKNLLAPITLHAAGNLGLLVLTIFYRIFFRKL